MKSGDLDKLEKEHGALASARTSDGRDIVIVRPKGSAFRRFTDKLTAEKGSKHSAAEELVLSCVVHPDRDQARSILDDYPALMLSLSAAAQELAGSDIEIKKSG